MKSKNKISLVSIRHPELVSGSDNLQMLKQVQHDKFEQFLYGIVYKSFRRILQCLPILLASAVVCYAEPVAAGSGVIPIKTVFIKFGITMGAVLASLLIIWSTLSTYKKFKASSVKEYKQQALYGDNFKTSTNVNEAIITFIDKNRL